MTNLTMLAQIDGIDSGDTAWLLAATAMVLLMTVGLGIFYAGLVRSKNTLNTFMMCIAALAVATISWALIGYSFAFAEGSHAVSPLSIPSICASIVRFVMATPAQRASRQPGLPRPCGSGPRGRAVARRSCRRPPRRSGHPRRAP